MLRYLLLASIGTVGALVFGPGAMESGRLAQGGGTAAPQGRGMPRDQPPAEKKGTAVIKGRVTALDTGRPLRRVKISVNSPEVQENRAVSTGSDGRFEVANLPAASYSVSVLRSGYLRLSYGQK